MVVLLRRYNCPGCLSGCKWLQVLEHSMVLQDQEGAQGLLNMAVKVKQVLVFKERRGVLFIFAPN